VSNLKIHGILDECDTDFVYDVPPRVAEQNGGDARFLDLLDQMRELHVRKSIDYGRDEDPLANLHVSSSIGIPSWKACWIRARDKISRIDTYCKTGKLKNEGVKDSLMDLAAYCLLTWILHEEESESFGALCDGEVSP